MGAVLLVAISLVFTTTGPTHEALLTAPGCVPGWHRDDGVRRELKRFNAPWKAVIAVRGCSVRVLGSQEDFDRFETLGFTVTMLPPPPLGGGYEDWGSVRSFIVDQVAQNGDVAQLVVFGYAASGLPLYGITLETPGGEALPLIRVTGAHHGNERISVENALAILRWLLTEEGRAWLSVYRFQVIPVVNPDGYVANTRHNGEGVDLNRNYGFGWESGDTINPFSEPETVSVSSLSWLSPALLHLDYHSAAEYVNTVFDYTPAASEDEALILDIGDIYAGFAGLETVVGYDWYQATGSSQDYHYAFEGSFAYTIETMDPSNPDALAQANAEAFAETISHLTSRVLCGRLTDSVSGAPLRGRLWLTDAPRPFYSDEQGRFCHVASEGTHTLNATAPGYGVASTQTTIPGGEEVTLALDEADPPYPPLRVVDMGDNDPNGYWPRENWPRYALVAGEGGTFSLGRRGRITLDMGYPVLDGDGDEFSVVEADVDGTADSARCLLAQYMTGPWVATGEYSGSFTVDIADSGLTWARYVRLESTSGQPFETYPGYDLDVVLSLGVSALDVDDDGDGYSPVTDCDDTDAERSPGESERCDEVDNNCNGLIDEGFPFSPRGEVLCSDAGVDTEDVTQDGDADGDTTPGGGEEGCHCSAARGPGKTHTLPLLFLLLGAALLRRRI